MKNFRNTRLITSIIIFIVGGLIYSYKETIKNTIGYQLPSASKENHLSSHETNQTSLTFATRSDIKSDTLPQYKQSTNPTLHQEEPPNGTSFHSAGESWTYSIIKLRASILNNGVEILRVSDYISGVRESPDESMFVSYSPEHGWQTHRIFEDRCETIDDELSDFEDIQVYWIDNEHLIGESVNYLSEEEEGILGLKEGMVSGTRLFVYNLETKKSVDIDTTSIVTSDNEFLRIDAISKDGHIKLTLVDSAGYFDSNSGRDLGFWRVKLPQ
jgi:hypothetical protein